MAKLVKNLTVDELKSIFISALNEYEQGRDEIWTIDQASEYLRLAKPTIYSMVSRKQIPCSKSGKRIIFSKHELITWMKSRNSQTLKNKS